jgi:hypothetical protein
MLAFWDFNKTFEIQKEGGREAISNFKLFAYTSWSYYNTLESRERERKIGQGSGSSGRPFEDIWRVGTHDDAGRL